MNRRMPNSTGEPGQNGHVSGFSAMTSSARSISSANSRARPSRWRSYQSPADATSAAAPECRMTVTVLTRPPSIQQPLAHVRPAFQSCRTGLHIAGTALDLGEPGFGRVAVLGTIETREQLLGNPRALRNRQGESARENVIAGHALILAHGPAISE